MAFAFSDQHIDEYRTQGYTVFLVNSCLLPSSPTYAESATRRET